jgi:hypothetical protein
MADETLLKILADLVKPFPGVKCEGRKGHLSFTVGKKVFAFTRNQGLALKLPAARIEALIAAGKADFLVMGKRRMKEWAYLERARPADFKKAAGLLREARDFAAGA